MVSSFVSRKVLVVDDHPIVRQGLTLLIDREPDLVVCGEAASVNEARALISERSPDVVVVDLSLQDSDGLELIKDIRSKRQEMPVLVLSMHDEAIYAERMLCAGANGYIMKQAASEQLLTALRRVLSGGVYVSEAVGAGMIARFTAGGARQVSDPIERLSNRELQIIKLIGQGNGTREIANSLNLSVKTIESHRQRIKKKLNIQTSPKLVQYAVNLIAAQN